MTPAMREILERRLDHKSTETDLVFYRINQRTGKPRKWSSNDDGTKDGLKALCRKVNIKEFSAGAFRNARAGYLVEASHHARRYNERLRSYYQRKCGKRNQAVATKAVCNKLARACYYIIRDQVAFREEALFCS